MDDQNTMPRPEGDDAENGGGQGGAPDMPAEGGAPDMPEEGGADDMNRPGGMA